MTTADKWLPREGSKAALFLELAQPNEHGFSDEITVDNFVGKYESLQMGNGGDWCRDNGPLGQRFNIKRHKSKGKIAGVSLEGYKKVSTRKPIPVNIRQQVKQNRCVVLDVGSVEVDHRDGRLDDPRLADAMQVTVADFQPLSKAANNAKRQHCRDCRTTGERYDATRLGFPVSQWRGGEDYIGTCVGCYWHDPREFIMQTTKHYPKHT